MPAALRIGLIGDHDPAIPAHAAIPRALAAAAVAQGRALAIEWLATEAIGAQTGFQRFDGLWCIPGSPYRSMAGALQAIRWARERGTPFLGTCGGFQHAVLEYARHVLGWSDAEHAESVPAAERPVIAPLRCPLIEVGGAVQLDPTSRLAAIYGRTRIEEDYHCSYGINPGLQAALLSGGLRAVAHDSEQEIRGVELTGHPFWIATLFQHERAALTGRPTPVVAAFVAACAAYAAAR